MNSIKVAVTELKSSQFYLQLPTQVLINYICGLYHFFQDQEFRHSLKMSSPLVLFKTTIGLLTVIFSTSLPKTSAVLYEDALERVYFAPRARDVQYLSLSGINSLNYDNVTEAYIKVLEGSQLVASLKNQMVSKQHCNSSTRFTNSD